MSSVHARACCATMIRWWRRSIYCAKQSIDCATMHLMIRRVRQPSIASWQRRSTGRRTLTEQFKSENALLQNSLLYFRLLSARLSTSEQMGPLTPAVSALAAAMLQLTLDTSTGGCARSCRPIGVLAARPPPAGEAESVRAILAHGRLLHDLLPTTDRVLKELLAAPSRPAAKGSAHDDFDAPEPLRGRRLASSGCFCTRPPASAWSSCPSRVTAPGTGFGVAAARCFRACDCRHLDALIDAQPHEIDARIDRALAVLAAHRRRPRLFRDLSGPARMTDGAGKRKHFRRAGPIECRRWSRASTRQVTGSFTSRTSTVSPRRSQRQACRRPTEGWVCVAKRREDGGTIVLGFDTLRSGITTQSAEIGLLRMALDAIANAGST